MPSIDGSRPLVLASASPRRRDLLRDLGLALAVRPVSVDESVRPGEDPSGYLERVVCAKLRAGSSALGDGAALLVADTAVVVDGAILGKPRDVNEAAALVGRLVGRTHVVMTRYAIGVRPNPAEPGAAKTISMTVEMRNATEEEILRYAATGEGLDKAGAYAIQGIGGFLVRGIVGSHSNVVGLPVCEVVEDLRALGILGPFP